MKKVTGIGGVFYKVENPEEHKKWYKENLGIESDQCGGKFAWILDPEGNKIELWEPIDGPLLDENN